MISWFNRLVTSAINHAMEAVLYEWHTIPVQLTGDKRLDHRNIMAACYNLLDTGIERDASEIVIRIEKSHKSLYSNVLVSAMYQDENGFSV